MKEGRMSYPIRPLRAVLVAVLVPLASCDFGTGTACPPGSSLSYENFGRSFMESHCLRCHSRVLTGAARRGAPVGMDFDTLERVRSYAFDIDNAAAAGPGGANTQMPPDTPKPTAAERQRLGEWLACGAR
jgi:uncharacterized membrane protein